MVSTAPVVRAAISQTRAKFGDLPATVELVADLSADAASQGVQLIAFGETWLPGYPAWLDHCPDAALWNNPATKDVFAALRANSVEVPGPVTERLAKISREHGLVLVIGVHERVAHGPGHGTLYNALLTFDPQRGLVNHHRKLVPTYTEKLVWGYGDAEGLRSVDTACGRVGALVCWEHWMPLTRQALHQTGEQIHIAAWPTVHEMHQVASRTYAFEGRCFVLASGGILSADQLPAALPPTADLQAAPETLVLRGGSAIVAPDGRYLAGPTYDTETLVVADLDLTEIDRESMTLDVTGHYARPDVFDFRVRPSTRAATAAHAPAPSTPA